MNPESFSTPPTQTETGVEKRREAAEEIRKLIDSATEAAEKLIEDQGGVVIRDKVVSLEKGNEGADLWFTESHLILEALEQKKAAAEEQGEYLIAKEFALAQEFFEHYHGSVATYLDALKNYPELKELMERMHPNFPEKLRESQEVYE